MVNIKPIILHFLIFGIFSISSIYSEEKKQYRFDKSELEKFDKAHQPNDIINLKTEEDLLKAIEVNKKYSHKRRGSADNMELVYLNSSQKSYFENRHSYLVGQLIKNHPNSVAIPELIEERWKVISRYQSFDIESEYKWFSQNFPEHGDVIKKGRFYEVEYFVMTRARSKADEALDKIEAFELKYPGDELNVELIFNGYRYFSRDDIKEKLMKHLETNYSDNKKVKGYLNKVKSMEKSRKRMVQNTGKDFKLKFKDVLTGDEIDLEKFKGKVVVIDFWATWCGPCVAELPKLKKVYEKYKDKGVEVIGISFDSKKDTLVDFCKTNEMPWPQYFDGEGWGNKIGKEWGISGIPRVFILDQEGKVYSVEGRSQMESIIPKLLAKQ